MDNKALPDEINNISDIIKILRFLKDSVEKKNTLSSFTFKIEKILFLMESGFAAKGITTPIQSSFQKNYYTKIARYIHFSPYFRTPIAVVPARPLHRMNVQSSVFTLFGGSCCWGEDDSYHPYVFQRGMNKTIEPFIVKFAYQKKEKPKILSELFELGIHEGSLFPEMDHQVTYLKKFGKNIKGGKN